MPTASCVNTVSWVRWRDGSVLLCKQKNLNSSGSTLSTHRKAMCGDTVGITVLGKQRQEDRFLELESQPV